MNAADTICQLLMLAILAAMQPLYWRLSTLSRAVKIGLQVVCLLVGLSVCWIDPAACGYAALGLAAPLTAAVIWSEWCRLMLDGPSGWRRWCWIGVTAMAPGGVLVAGVAWFASRSREFRGEGGGIELTVWAVSLIPLLLVAWRFIRARAAARMIRYPHAYEPATDWDAVTPAATGAAADGRRGKQSAASRSRP